MYIREVYISRKRSKVYSVVYTHFVYANIIMSCTNVCIQYAYDKDTFSRRLFDTTLEKNSLHVHICTFVSSFLLYLLIYGYSVPCTQCTLSRSFSSIYFSLQKKFLLYFLSDKIWNITFIITSHNQKRNCFMKTFLIYWIF